MKNQMRKEKILFHKSELRKLALEERREQAKDRDIHKRFRQCRSDAEAVEKVVHHREKVLSGAPVHSKNDLVAIAFFGACGGEWVAHVHYLGDLPGFGGFMIFAGGVNLLVDPGRGSLDSMRALGIDPGSLDMVIATNKHWDTTRDLNLILMASTGPWSGKEARPPRLLSTRSVLYGHAIKKSSPVNHENYVRYSGEKQVQQTYGDVVLFQPPVVSVHDLIARLKGQYGLLEIGKKYVVSKDLTIYTRESYHTELPGALKTIPALDMVLRREGKVAARCVYLSNTEYRPELADLYARDLSVVGPIDVLIINVKTIHLYEHRTGPYKGFTKRHLGWRGAVQFVKDLHEAGALKPSSLVVLRGWGLETVSRDDKELNCIVAEPEKLKIYEKKFQKDTGYRALVPGLTWVRAYSGPDGETAVSAQHVQRPFEAVEDRGILTFGGCLFYRSRIMRDIVKKMTPLLNSLKTIILITGDSGVGKDWLARAIHEEARKRGYERENYVSENCSILSRENAWPTLVGASRGAFTGSIEKLPGWFGKAEKGTLVLQEIADMDLEIQPKLLTALEERCYRRHGDLKLSVLDSRIIFTTNIDLSKAVRDGKFRQELYGRIGMVIKIPPLRERPEDIDAMVTGWVREGHFPAAFMNEEVIRTLTDFDWPLNVRSLRNTLEAVKISRDYSVNNFCREAESRQEKYVSDAGITTGKDYCPDPLDERIVHIMAGGGQWFRRDIQDELHQMPKLHNFDTFSKTTVIKRIGRLVEMGVIKRMGAGSRTCYSLPVSKSAPSE